MMADVRKPFEQSGKFADEITIRFENCKEQLYVSKTLLGHVSLVFQTMFQCGLKEANTSELEIKDISRVDFLEFLLCCDPGTLKDITKDNVLPVVVIAHKYDAQHLVAKCEIIMNSWLKECSIDPAAAFDSSQISKAIICLKILQKSHDLGFKNITDEAIVNASKLCSEIYLSPKSQKPTISTRPVVRPTYESECFRMFQNLPGAVREKIMIARLSLIDKVSK